MEGRGLRFRLVCGLRFDGNGRSKKDAELKKGVSRKLGHLPRKIISL